MLQNGRMHCWRALVLILLCVCVLHPHPGGSASKTVLLATTTSTRDSGLLDVLLPVFQAHSDMTVKIIAVGTGKALALGKRGDVDILVTHAPEAEQQLVAEGWLVQRVTFMHNDFVIVGPRDDPATVQTAPDAPAALQRIASARATFVSRADNSGTHQKEKALWRSAHVSPQGDWYLEAGQGMGATLRIASEKGAYTLTDRSTYLHLQATLRSVIVFAGDPVLHNIYSVMLVNPKRHPKVHAEAAKAFHTWLLSQTARDLIRAYGQERFGQPLFALEPLP